MNDISPVLVAHGRSGELSFDGRHVRITHDSRSAKFIHGRAAAEKVIPIDAIASVQFEAATVLFHGHIQLTIVGETPALFAPRRVTGGLARNRRICRDQSSIMFGVSVTDDFERIAGEIRERI